MALDVSQFFALNGFEKLEKSILVSMLIRKTKQLRFFDEMRSEQLTVSFPFFKYLFVLMKFSFHAIYVTF